MAYDNITLCPREANCLVQVGPAIFMMNSHHVLATKSSMSGKLTSSGWELGHICTPPVGTHSLHTRVWLRHTGIAAYPSVSLVCLFIDLGNEGEERGRRWILVEPLAPQQVVRTLVLLLRHPSHALVILTRLGLMLGLSIFSFSPRCLQSGTDGSGEGIPKGWGFCLFFFVGFFFF